MSSYRKLFCPFVGSDLTSKTWRRRRLRSDTWFDSHRSRSSCFILSRTNRDVSSSFLVESRLRPEKVQGVETAQETRIPCKAQQAILVKSRNRVSEVSFSICSTLLWTEWNCLQFCKSLRFLFRKSANQDLFVCKIY